MIIIKIVEHLIEKGKDWRGDGIKQMLLDAIMFLIGLSMLIGILTL